MRKNRGFTLAEMLIVVAITVILLGVAFVGVQRYQASMTRLELDSIAKEIFVAAQNHLTSAEGQGYLGVLSTEADKGYPGTLTEDKSGGNQVVYYVLNDGAKDTVLNLMLPSYAIDQTIRAGSFIIRYEPSTATVMDVFYSRPQRGFLTRSGTTFSADDYDTLMTGGYRGEDAKRSRENYNNARQVIGWYGGADPGVRGERLRVPSFRIVNAERLWVEVTDPNVGSAFDELQPSLKLIVTGTLSGSEQVFSLRRDGRSVVDNTENLGRVTLKDGVYTVVLDAITPDVGGSDLRFSNLTGFLPGENLKVKVVAYSNVTLSNIAVSEEKTTNSLFADPAPALRNGSEIEERKVSITNLRHLENLDPNVSNYQYEQVGRNTSGGVSATQLSDLSWPDFLTRIKDQTGVDNAAVLYNDSDKTTAGNYYPVTPDYALDYDGNQKKITEIKVSHSGNAGLFGALPENSTVRDLELIDFSVSSTAAGSTAGALAGSAENTAVNNVLAHNSAAGFDPTITAAGSAGGLIGSMTGGSVIHSAAALVVGNSGTATAGGLIGTADGAVSVTGCYAGGHTDKGEYWNHDDEGKRTTAIYNVTASGTAGGLIGSAGAATIKDSYSTCSVTGATAGGLAGSSDGTITHCYAVGLVGGTGAKAFVGTGSATVSAEAGSESWYYEAVNGVEVKNAAGAVTAIDYLEPGNANVKALDESAASYEAFVGPASGWKVAKPYDSELEDFYQGKYNLRIVEQLGESTQAVDFVKDHYGDWPAPEVFLFNN